MVWAILNAVCLAAPFVLLWGWVQYLTIPTRSDWRSHASVLGLAAPLISFVIWMVALILAQAREWPKNHTPAVRHLTTLGVWIPIIGMAVGLLGRPRLILAIVPVSIATVLFWFGTTLP